MEQNTPAQPAGYADGLRDALRSACSCVPDNKDEPYGHSITCATRIGWPLLAKIDGLLSAFVAEGWWHPNVKDGRVHDHPASPGRSWSSASHRLCERVYTNRTPSHIDSDGGA